MDLDQQTPEQHRARYDALRANARAIATPSIPASPSLDGHDIMSRETIPPGWYTTMRVARGHALRLINAAGNPGVSILLWNADETSERYNAGDTLKLQWTARLHAGRVLFSDMGRVMASITADTCGRHDALLGGSTAASNARQFGNAPLRDTANNFRIAAGKMGLSVRDIPPCLTLFAGVGVDDGGGFAWQPGATNPGDIVDLRAEMNLLVAVSNCPHPLAPGPAWPQGPLDIVVWTPPTAGPDDPCRTYGEEAGRGFMNTDALFARGGVHV